MAREIIDACAQLGSGDRVGDILESGITVDTIISNMDFAGIQRSVIYPTTWDDYDKANAEIFQIVKGTPNRFIGFARINPTTPMAEKILRHALENYGFRGIRLRPYHDRFELKDPRVERILSLAREFCVPVGVDGERNKETLFKIVKEHPETPIILMHLGSFDNWDWRNTLAYLSLLQDAPNFYLASCFEIIHFFLEDIIRKVPTKVVFGSDSPTLPPAMELKRIEVMKLEPEQYELVVGGNLLRILTSPQ